MHIGLYWYVSHVSNMLYHSATCEAMEVNNTFCLRDWTTIDDSLPTKSIGKAWAKLMVGPRFLGLSLVQLDHIVWTGSYVFYCIVSQIYNIYD